MGLHSTVVAAAMIGMPSIERKLEPAPPPINIDFVQIAEKDNFATKPVETEKRAEPKAVKQNNFARSAPTPQAKTPDAVPLPKEARKEATKPKPDKDPTLAERNKLRSVVRPRSKPKAPSRIRSDRLAALLDKSIKEDVQQQQDAEADKQQQADALKKKLEQAEENKLQNRLATASLKTALQEKLAGCWRFPGGAKGVENMRVTVRIWLNGDGTLARQPQFLDAGDLNDPSRAYFRTFAESARRAVKICEPYEEAVKVMGTSAPVIDFEFDGAEFAGG